MKLTELQQREFDIAFEAEIKRNFPDVSGLALDLMKSWAMQWFSFGCSVSDGEAESKIRDLANQFGMKKNQY